MSKRSLVRNLRFKIADLREDGWQMSDIEKILIAAGWPTNAVRQALEAA